MFLNLTGVAMGIGQTLRKLADRAKEKVQPEHAERGVDKAAEQVDQRTGGKHQSKIEKGREKGRGAAGKYFQE